MPTLPVTIQLTCSYPIYFPRYRQQMITLNHIQNMATVTYLSRAYTHCRNPDTLFRETRCLSGMSDINPYLTTYCTILLPGSFNTIQAHISIPAESTKQNEIKLLRLSNTCQLRIYPAKTQHLLNIQLACCSHFSFLILVGAVVQFVGCQPAIDLVNNLVYHARIKQKWVVVPLSIVPHSHV